MDSASSYDKTTRDALWNRAVDFHGHSCPGLMIGFRAALYAAELLRLSFAEDEETVCIAENDSCSVDAIQAVLGCTVGKGNLLFHLRGKQAFSFYNRKSGESIRLIQKRPPADMTRKEKLEFFKTCSNEEMFDSAPVKLAPPEEARIFQTVSCSKCGEAAGDYWMRLVNGEAVCLDCFEEYHRLSV